MTALTELAGIIADFPDDPRAAARAILDAGYAVPSASDDDTAA